MTKEPFYACPKEQKYPLKGIHFWRIYQQQNIFFMFLHINGVMVLKFSAKQPHLVVQPTSPDTSRTLFTLQNWNSRPTNIPPYSLLPSAPSNQHPPFCLCESDYFTCITWRGLHSIYPSVAGSVHPALCPQGSSTCSMCLLTSHVTGKPKPSEWNVEPRASPQWGLLNRQTGWM